MSNERNGGDQHGGTRKPPAHVIAFGRIRATIWANQDTDGGTWYSVTLTRTYQDGAGKTKSATSFGRDDLLVAAEAMRLAYHWIAMKPGSRSSQSDASEGPAD